MIPLLDVRVLLQLVLGFALILAGVIVIGVGQLPGLISGNPWVDLVPSVPWSVGLPI